MSHDHAHGHVQPGSVGLANRRRLGAVLVISLVVLVAEVVGAVVSNSLALLADAGHVLTDVSGLAMALIAISFANRPASSGRTFGFLRLEILAAVGNAVLLGAVSLYVLAEAIQRLWQPAGIRSELMLAVAIVGLAANLVALLLLRKGQADSLNLRGAYLEVMGDALGSVAVIAAASLIALTGWTPADVVASLVIGAMILPRAWGLLREAIDILLEATPRGVDLEVVRRHILEAPGVLDCHDLHAWTITSGLPVVSAHVVLHESAQPGVVLDFLCRCLSDDFDIEHSTFQLESADRRRLEEWSHA